MFADAPEVFPDLGTIRIFLRRNVVKLFEQWYVAIGIVVALDAGESVPVPDATEIPSHLDNPDVVDAGLLQVCAGQQARNAPAEDVDVDVLGDGVANNGCSVWVDLVELGELTRELDVLLGALGAKPLGTLLRVFFPQCGDVDVVRCLSRRRIGHRSVSLESSRGAPVPMYFDN